jgi:tetratricopeptide (TPR) repeat protein
VIRDGLRALPDEEHLRTEELVALIELGRLKEALERRDDWFKRTEPFANNFWNPGQVDLCLAMELRAHNHPVETQSLLRQAEDWYRQNPRAQQSEPVPIPCTIRLFSPAYYLGQWNEARATYQRMLASDSTSVLAHEGLGVLAARSHDLLQVGRIDRWLATHGSEKGRSSYARARMAALLGDRDHAVALLRDAFEQGLWHRMYVRLDPDLATLHDLPSFRQLFEVRG